MLLRRVASTASAAAAARRGASRGFIGGAFPTDHEITRSTIRRARINSFLKALDLPAASQVPAAEVVRQTLTAHAPSGEFVSRAQLQGAVDDARSRLAELQTASLHLELDPYYTQGSTATAEAAAVGMTPTPIAAAAPEPSLVSQSGAAALAGPDGAAPPAQASLAVAPDAAAAAEPVPGAPAAPLVEPGARAPDELSEEVQLTLGSLRAATALDGLPALWAKMLAYSADTPGAPAAEAALPLPLALSVASRLASLDPWERVALQLELAGRDGAAPMPSVATAAELRNAALGSVACSSQALTLELLRQSGLLYGSEKLRARELSPEPPAQSWTGRLATPADPLMAELRRRSSFTMLRHALGGGAAAQLTDAEGDDPSLASLKAVASSEPREAALFGALRTEASLNLALADSFFAYHDRRATRWRRLVNAGKASALFVTLNLADFTLTNI